VHEDSRKIYLFDWLDQKGEIGQQLIEFTNLLQAPEEIFTFDLSPYTLWTASAKGISEDNIISFLEEYSQNEITEEFKNKIKKNIREFGTLEFYIKDDTLYLQAKHEDIIAHVKMIQSIDSLIIDEPDDQTIGFLLQYRTQIKKILFYNEFFVKDASYESGDYLDLKLLPKTSEGELRLRDYQLNAANAYVNYQEKTGGGGTIILPPNSGKTLVGLKVIEELKTTTLIVVDGSYNAEKWKKEIIDKTDLAEDHVSIYKESREIKPITIGEYPDVSEYRSQLHGFGLIIYDNAYKLPTSINEKTTEIKSKFKLAMTSTLARADEQGDEVYALVGPRWYEILPRILVEKGYHVPVLCVEVKVPLSDDDREIYRFHLSAKNYSEMRNMAGKNELKDEIVKELLHHFKKEKTLIISYYVDPTIRMKEKFDFDLIIADTQNVEEIVEAFNKNDIRKLITSSVKIEKISLKGIEVSIAVSYQQGSEREEYLRIGKLMEAKKGKNQGYLFSLVSKNTIEENKDYIKRRRRLIRNGFRYRIMTSSDVIEGRFIRED
jgi:DNA excision repair protein ERCC-3